MPKSNSSKLSNEASPSKIPQKINEKRRSEIEAKVNSAMVAYKAQSGSINPLPQPDKSARSAVVKKLLIAYLTDVQERTDFPKFTLDQYRTYPFESFVQAKGFFGVHPLCVKDAEKILAQGVLGRDINQHNKFQKRTKNNAYDQGNLHPKSVVFSTNSSKTQAVKICLLFQMLHFAASQMLDDGDGKRKNLLGFLDISNDLVELKVLMDDSKGSNRSRTEGRKALVKRLMARYEALVRNGILGSDFDDTFEQRQAWEHLLGQLRGVDDASVEAARNEIAGTGLDLPVNGLGDCSSTDVPSFNIQKHHFDSLKTLMHSRATKLADREKVRFVKMVVDAHEKMFEAKRVPETGEHQVEHSTALQGQLEKAEKEGTVTTAALAFYNEWKLDPRWQNFVESCQEAQSQVLSQSSDVVAIQKIKFDDGRLSRASANLYRFGDGERQYPISESAYRQMLDFLDEREQSAQEILKRAEAKSEAEQEFNEVVADEVRSGIEVFAQLGDTDNPKEMVSAALSKVDKKESLSYLDQAVLKGMDLVMRQRQKEELYHFAQTIVDETVKADGQDQSIADVLKLVRAFLEASDKATQEGMYLDLSFFSKREKISCAACVNQLATECGMQPKSQACKVTLSIITALIKEQKTQSTSDAEQNILHKNPFEISQFPDGFIQTTHPSAIAAAELRKANVALDEAQSWSKNREKQIVEITKVFNNNSFAQIPKEAQGLLVHYLSDVRHVGSYALGLFAAVKGYPYKEGNPVLLQASHALQVEAQSLLNSWRFSPEEQDYLRGCVIFALLRYVADQSDQTRYLIGILESHCHTPEKIAQLASGDVSPIPVSMEVLNFFREIAKDLQFDPNTVNLKRLRQFSELTCVSCGKDPREEQASFRLSFLPQAKFSKQGIENVTNEVQGFVTQQQQQQVSDRLFILCLQRALATAAAELAKLAESAKLSERKWAVSANNAVPLNARLEVLSKSLESETSSSKEIQEVWDQINALLGDAGRNLHEAIASQVKAGWDVQKGIAAAGAKVFSGSAFEIVAGSIQGNKEKQLVVAVSQGDEDLKIVPEFALGAADTLLTTVTSLFHEELKRVQEEADKAFAEKRAKLGGGSSSLLRSRSDGKQEIPDGSTSEMGQPPSQVEENDIDTLVATLVFNYKGTLKSGELGTRQGFLDFANSAEQQGICSDDVWKKVKSQAWTNLSEGRWAVICSSGEEEENNDSFGSFSYGYRTDSKQAPLFPGSQDIEEENTQGTRSSSRSSSSSNSERSQSEESSTEKLTEQLAATGNKGTSGVNKWVPLLEKESGKSQQGNSKKDKKSVLTRLFGKFGGNKGNGRTDLPNVGDKGADSSTNSSPKPGSNNGDSSSS